MENFRSLRNTQIIILGLCIAVATIVSSVILSQGFIRIMKITQEQITVTGSANKPVASDYVTWNASFTVRDPDLGKAYKHLRADLDTVKAYLKAKGVTDQELTIPQISTQQFFKRDMHGGDTNEVSEYRLTQTVEVRSEDLAKVTAISRNITELIDKQIEVDSSAPEYLYRKLDDLKVEMLALATENAKLRAANMAKATGNMIGPIRSAKMGVFQITPVDSNDVSGLGINDTSSQMKKVTAVVTASFAIE